MQGALGGEEVDAKYGIYSRAPTADNRDQAGLASSTDLLHWTEATQLPVLPVRPGRFDSRVAEPGPPPFVTQKGIVLIYNGADDKLVYRTGIAIFDRNDPRKLLWRSDDPVFVPEKAWEKTGQVPNVVFVEGMVQQPERYLFYYGGADSYVGVAEVRLNRSRSRCRYACSPHTPDELSSRPPTPEAALPPALSPLPAY